MKFLATLLFFLTFSVFSAETLNISKTNAVILSGEIESTSILTTGIELVHLSNNLPKNKTIYLIINSVGGEIDSGIAFIELMKSIPQKIVSVTIEASSMAAFISQFASENLIQEHGFMMLHLPRGPFEGTFAYGQVERELLFYQKQMEKIYKQILKKTKMKRSELLNILKFDTYLTDVDSVRLKFASKIVNIQCYNEFNTKNICPFLSK